MTSHPYGIVPKCNLEKAVDAVSEAIGARRELRSYAAEKGGGYANAEAYEQQLVAIRGLLSSREVVTTDFLKQAAALKGKDQGMRYCPHDYDRDSSGGDDYWLGASEDEVRNDRGNQLVQKIHDSFDAAFEAVSMSGLLKETKVLEVELAVAGGRSR